MTSSFFDYNETGRFYEIKGFSTSLPIQCPITEVYFSDGGLVKKTVNELTFDSSTCKNELNCQRFKVNTTMDRFEHSVSFYVVAISPRGSYKVSPQVQLNFRQDPNLNLHSPELTKNLPEEIKMPYNVEVMYVLPKPFDLDVNDKVILFDNFTVEPPTEIFFFNNESRMITLRQSEPPIKKETFKISFLIHDTRGRNNTYSFRIKLEEVTTEVKDKINFNPLSANMELPQD